jgi:hypothetical protein
MKKLSELKPDDMIYVSVDGPPFREFHWMVSELKEEVRSEIIEVDNIIEIEFDDPNENELIKVEIDIDFTEDENHD